LFGVFYGEACFWKKKTHKQKKKEKSRFQTRIFFYISNNKRKFETIKMNLKQPKTRGHLIHFRTSNGARGGQGVHSRGGGGGGRGAS
jgi:hypothetical protein